MSDDNDNICPACGSSLRGAPISEDHREHYGDGVTHYSRRVGIELRGVYDGVIAWGCPDCRAVWARFPSGRLADPALVERARRAFGGDPAPEDRWQG